jgi:hypothetical protein
MDVSFCPFIVSKGAGLKKERMIFHYLQFDITASDILLSSGKF